MFTVTFSQPNELFKIKTDVNSVVIADFNSVQMCIGSVTKEYVDDRDTYVMNWVNNKSKPIYTPTEIGIETISNEELLSILE